MGTALETSVKRLLRYDFTATEVTELSTELANKVQEQANVERVKKASVSSYGSQLAAIKSDIGTLSDKVASGYEIREVNCDVQYHKPEQGKKTLTRSDTGQKIVEKMTDEEWNLFNQSDL